MGIRPMAKLTSKPKPSLNGAEIGRCVMCKRGIYPYQEHGRAPLPWLGMAHADIKDCPELAQAGAR